MASTSDTKCRVMHCQITPTSTRLPRRDGRTRPFLSRVCQKTKLCKLYLEGTCGRGDECAFAHGVEQIQHTPDLQCTKLCPRMERTGVCNRGSLCKFAHSTEELRGLSPALRSMLPSTWQQSDARVVSALNHAVAAGALSLGEMIMHLAKIFVAACEAKSPMMTSEVPTELLAAVTAEQAWASLNRARSERLTFEDFLRLSVLPSWVAGSQGSDVGLKHADDGMSVQSTVESGGDSSPRSSRCQTPSSPRSLGSQTPSSPRSPVSQTPSPRSFSSWESPSAQDLLCVRNTFIELKTVANPSAQVTRRARSLPPSHA